MALSKHKNTFGNKYILFIIIISLGVGLLIHFPELISLSDRWERDELFPGITPREVFFEIFFTFISLLLLFAVNTLIFKFNKPSTQVSWKKLLLSFVLTWILSNLSGQVFVYMHQHFNVPAIDAMVHHYLHPVRDFIITIIVTGSCYIIHLIRQHQQVLIENEQLHAENILNQYEALKSQLNPHMLFNSLNTLQSLIRETPDKAQNYLQELSKVLRYTLQGNESQSVPLKEEMNFVNAYLFLLKTRYEDNLRFDVHIDETFLTHQLPPMSVQMLVENAVKHNEISNRKPLTIHVYTEKNGWLCISNKIQPKLTKGNSTGIGLANLSKRFHLLFKQEIQIQSEQNNFSVRIPLIPDDV